MPRHSSQTATGRILAVQEERFRFMTDSGDTFLFTLGRFTHVGMSDLRQWHREGIRLRLEYTGEPNLASGTACRIFPAIETR